MNDTDKSMNRYCTTSSLISQDTRIHEGSRNTSKCANARWLAGVAYDGGLIAMQGGLFMFP